MVRAAEEVSLDWKVIWTGEFDVPVNFLPLNFFSSSLLVGIKAYVLV